MNKLRCYMMYALLAFVSNAFAVDGLRIADFSIMPGETKTISVEFDNPDDSYIMLDFNLRLPEGLTINTDEEGELMVIPNDARFTRTHSLVASETEDHTYRVLIYSSRNAAIKGNSGELFTITVSADADAIEGEKQGSIYNQVFSNENQIEYDPADITFNVTIGEAIAQGDADGDGLLTTSDAIAVVDFLLNNGKSEGNFSIENADVNGDGSISIADVTAIINLILNK